MQRPAIAGGTPIRPPERPLIFGAPDIGEAEIAAVTDCLRSKWIGSGARVEEFERQFACYKGAPYAVAVSSGTAALSLSLLGLGIGPGDEVIAPTMTFCATVHSIVHTGATPVLVDCRSTTFNIDPDAIEQRITSRTKAIVVVHMCGRCCEMDAIMDIARRHNLKVIEDCAHAIESRYKGRAAGLIGDVGCFSFYPTKHITTGDGGMVVTRDRELLKRIKILSRQGMTDSAWDRCTSGRAGYEVVEAGFKCNMTDLAAAMGLAQIGNLTSRRERREEVWRFYNDQLQELPLLLPPAPEPETVHAYHLYTPLLDLDRLAVGRDAVTSALQAENVGVGIHYIPVHAQPYYRHRFGFRRSDFPNASYVGDRTFSIPLSPSFSIEDVADVCSALRRVLRYYTTTQNWRTPVLNSGLPMEE